MNSRNAATSTLLFGLLVAGGALGEAAPGARTDATQALLEVVSDSSCPASDTVGALLRQILGLYSGEHVEETAELVHDGNELVVRLRGKDSRLIGERKLPREGSCDELARAAAVVLSSWLSEAHPELVPAAPFREAAPPAPNPAPPVSAPEPPAPPQDGNVHGSGRVVPVARLRLRPSAAAGIALLPTAPAVAGVASFALIPETTGLGGVLRAGVVASRSLDVQDRSARYRRWPLEAAGVLRFAAPRFAVELEAGAALGWLSVEGRTFTPNQRADDVTYGPAAAARLLYGRGMAQPFVEVTATYWAKVARLYGDPARPSTELPSLDLALLLGVAVLP